MMQQRWLFVTCITACTPIAVSSDGAQTVWNYAYQENYAADTIADIRTNAVDAYVLLDPFKGDFPTDHAAFIRALKSKGNAVSAYISVGTGENWRGDFAALRPYLVDRQWGEWAGEYFVSAPGDTVLEVMQRRIDMIADWGYDWVEFDNMDWANDDDYRRDYSIGASPSDAADYVNTLCDYVHDKGMKCMAKSTVEGASNFDGVTYESYPDDQNWWDVDGTRQFLSAGKPVVIVHYDEANCAGRYAAYRAIYGNAISFICEDPRVAGYVRFGG